MPASEPAAENEFPLINPQAREEFDSAVDIDGIAEDDLAQTLAVLEALRRWHHAERRMSEASRRYMNLGETDMRALRYAMAAERSRTVVTPSMLAQHLGISTASVTKMLDRLQKAGHITRSAHHEDRRSTAVAVTPETRQSAREAVGRSHAERFRVALELSVAERQTVIAFLRRLADTAAAAPPVEDHPQR